jgi:hypothetical protein
MTLDLQALPLEHARKVFPPLWVVYFHPSDYPLDYVVRVHWGMTQEPTCEVFNTLGECRAFIRDAGGCVQFAHQQGEAECILESWL